MLGRDEALHGQVNLLINSSRGLLFTPETSKRNEIEMCSRVLNKELLTKWSTTQGEKDWKMLNKHGITKEGVAKIRDHAEEFYKAMPIGIPIKGEIDALIILYYSNCVDKLRHYLQLFEEDINIDTDLMDKPCLLKVEIFTNQVKKIGKIGDLVLPNPYRFLYSSFIDRLRNIIETIEEKSSKIDLTKFIFNPEYEKYQIFRRN